MGELELALLVKREKKEVHRRGEAGFGKSAQPAGRFGRSEIAGEIGEGEKEGDLALGEPQTVHQRRLGTGSPSSAADQQSRAAWISPSSSASIFPNKAVSRSCGAMRAISAR